MSSWSLYLSGGDTSTAFLTGQYTLEHESEIGLKYVNESRDTKITYSDRVTNFMGGSWRIAKNLSPYTLYFANASRLSTPPVSGWMSIDSEPLSASVDVITTPPLTASTPTPTPTPSPSTTIPSPTPTPTPTPTPSYERGLYQNELTETNNVYAWPTVNYVSHIDLDSNTGYNVLITGYSMIYTTNVFLSCNNDALDMTTITPVNDKQFASFQGVEIEFSIVSDNEIIITIPPISKACELDVIIHNPAGYGKLTPKYKLSNTEWTVDNIQHSTIEIN